MKKLYLSLLSIVCVFILCGCGYSRIYDMTHSNIAECRQVMYVGKTNNLSVNLISGTREQNYVVNGYCTDSIAFGVLTFKLLTDINIDTANYVLTIGTTRYDGILERNPYDNTYMCDVKTLINTNDVITAKIIAGEFVESVELNNITADWNVNSDNALKLAVSELTKELKTFIENDEFKAECYIKIVNDDEVNEMYYWYVSFVGRNGKTYAVIIDPISNEILAKK